MVDRILAALGRWPDGMHDLGEPQVGVPLDWPPTVTDVYLAFDGGRLFGDSLSVVAIADAPAWDERGRLALVEWLAEPIEVDRDGRVWRADPETGEDVCDGTGFDRWLYGAIEATALLHDRDGEFREDAFTEEGELADETATAMAKAQVRRDPKAPGPRWRLARALVARGDLDTARTELEEVVAHAPRQAWAWLDLARLSERLGAVTGAVDEAEAAADADPAHEHRGHFFAEAARLAAAAGDEPRRATLAARAIAATPGLVASQLAGVEDRIADGDLAAAAHLIALARALAPRDLAVLDLARKIDAARAAN
ncbi:MAG: tetratricopeptide repeat protein [Myxococcales bacterium]|nr:tetratricopeptide repeat protein [Myxococcales bacterium]